MSIVAVAGSAFTFYIPGLEDQANAGLFKSSPTIAAGDFTLSINGGAFDSLDNTPTVAPAGGTQIQVILSATETTEAGDGGKITVVCADAAGAEWYSVGFVIDVRAADLPTATEVVAAIDADPPGVDLVDAPNATAVAAIQNTLATYDNVASVLSSINGQTAIFVGMIQAITGARGNFAAVASAGTISSGSEQSGTYASTKALDNASVWRVGGSTLIDFYLTFTVPAGSVMRAIVVRAECNNSQVPAFYVSNNASDWTSLGQQSEAVPDQYEIDTFILAPSNAVTAGEDGLVYVRVYASYYGPLTLNVSYIAVVMEDAAGGGLTAQEMADAVNNLVAAGATASVGEKLDAILEDTEATLPGLVGGMATQASVDDLPTTADIDAALTASHGAGSWISPAGAGTVPYPYTVTNHLGDPVAGARVVATTDVDGMNKYSEVWTNEFGVAILHLTPGDWYFWVYYSGFRPPLGERPDHEVVA